MQISTVNETLLIRAATAIVGSQATNAILALYLMLDGTSKEGYELGKSIAEDGVEAAINEAWDHGFEVGEADADDAYVQGVSDARRNPSLADELVAEIVSEQAQNAINGEFDIDEDGYTIGG